jgi:hypothetical protein
MPPSEIPPPTGGPKPHEAPPAYEPPPKAPTDSPPPYAPDAPPATGLLPKGTSGVFAADPELVSKGATHISLISGMLAATTEQAQLVYIEPEGHGPIASALREKFVPAKKDSDDFVHSLHTLVKGESEKTAALARLLPRVNDATVDAASSMRRPQPG